MIAGFHLEDSTTHTVYTIIDKEYVSELKEILSVQSSHFNQKLAQVFNQYHLEWRRIMFLNN